MDEIDVRPLHRDELREAALVAARGMRDNPMHVAAIGDNPQRRVELMRRVFSRVLPAHGRDTVGAWRDGTLVGVAAWAGAGHCQPTGRELLRLLPVIVRAGRRVGRVRTWLGTWAEHDPDRSHSHLGPVSVDLGEQRQGIGSLLMAAYCRHIDEGELVAYLETDKAKNVGFYERFGFEVNEEADVIGVRNWFMSREPRAGR